jgi:hypothetical protein
MRFQVHWSDLPIWRKVVLICCLGPFLYLGYMDAYEHFKIYTSAPDVPTPTTGQIYPVHVMHRSLKYVTLKEREEVLFWRDKANLAGIPFLVAFVVLASFRNRNDKGNENKTGTEISG